MLDGIKQYNFKRDQQWRHVTQIVWLRVESCHHIVITSVPQSLRLQTISSVSLQGSLEKEADQQFEVTTWIVYTNYITNPRYNLPCLAKEKSRKKLTIS